MVLAMAAGADAAAQTPETVAEVRVHGNYRTPDAAVLTMAGIAIGQPIDAGGVEVLGDLG